MTSPNPDGVGFTVGPWRVSQANTSFVIIPWEGGAFGGWSVSCGTPANAALIAAAPDLYEALKVAEKALAQITAFESDARYIMGNTNFEIVKLRRAQIQAALSKARSL